MKTFNWYDFANGFIVVILLIVSVFGGAVIVMNGIHPVVSLLFTTVAFVMTGAFATSGVTLLRMKREQEQARLDAAWDRLSGSHMNTVTGSDTHTGEQR